MTGDTEPDQLERVGTVNSSLTDPTAAPLQAHEGGPPAWVVLESAYEDAAADLEVGDRITIVTWLHLARRDTLRVHPRSDAGVPTRGVFSTRSQDRPNPIGLHTATITATDGLRIRVDHLEAVDGTPVLDIKIAQ